MKKKIMVVMICTLLISTMASFTAIANKCESKPNTNTILQNSPPENPTLEITETVKVGGILYVNAISTDPDNDDIYYRLNLSSKLFGWILCWEGPYQSGEEYSECFELNLLFGIGTFTLGVQAKDINGAESDWVYKDFRVILSRSTTSPILNFLQSHPNLFSLLRYILKLG